jgi:hypothetical protein
MFWYLSGFYVRANGRREARQKFMALGFACVETLRVSCGLGKPGMFVAPSRFYGCLK